MYESTLVLVATPIGNLGDLSTRAIEALTKADLICCEDTRRTRKLLTHIGVSGTPLIRLDDHTEKDNAKWVFKALSEQKAVALVSDSGMPGLCDPGARLVTAVTEAGYPVTVIPGPSAGVTALALSGFPAARHVFEGFLPRKGSARTKRLQEIADEQRAVIIFESPNRTAQTLEDLAKACGNDRQAVVAREMTKLHEDVIRGTLTELAGVTDQIKGEVVIVIAGSTEPTNEPTDDELIAALTDAVNKGTTKRSASDEVAAAYQVSRRRTYNLLHPK